MNMRLPTVLLLLSACGENKESGWFPHCDETATVVSSDDTTLGFSADDVLAVWQRAQTGEIQDSDDVTEAAAFTTILRGDVELVRQVEATPPAGVTDLPAIAVECEDYLRIPVTHTIATPMFAFPSLDVELQAFGKLRSLFSYEAPDLAPYRQALDDAGFGLEEGETEEAIRFSGAILSEGDVEPAYEGDMLYIAEGSDADTAWQRAEPVFTWSTTLTPDNQQTLLGDCPADPDALADWSGDVIDLDLDLDSVYDLTTAVVTSQAEYDALSIPTELPDTVDFNTHVVLLTRIYSSSTCGYSDTAFRVADDAGSPTLITEATDTTGTCLDVCDMEYAYTAAVAVEKTGTPAACAIRTDTCGN